MAGPYRVPVALPASRLVPPPVRSRRLAAGLAIIFLLFGVFTLASPWQQNIKGVGRVLAYAPMERHQGIDAPVAGRVIRWYVQEGSRVRAGDRIVEIVDNDPQFMARLLAEREAIETRLEAQTQSVAANRARLESVIGAQANAVVATEARLRAARQAVEGAEQNEQAAEANLETALLQLARRQALVDQGLVSRRELEVAILDEARARTEREAARARASAARAQQQAQQAEVERARAEAQVATEAARSSVQSAESEVAASRASIARLDVSVSRQEAQLVTAPADGTLFRVRGGRGNEQVSVGARLAELVPDTASRAVELWVDGNDAALISPGRRVRLQFEGWPAVQFVGWPSVAVGTFGGLVDFIDATDDGRGDFRIVVVPDPDDEPWPSARYLRQGVRSNGWVLLERVSVAFELWRQLNGFPPTIDRPADSESGQSGERPSESGGWY